jgi:PAS domain S-box-containing protein
MQNDKTRSPYDQSLRQRAEEAVRTKGCSTPLSEADVRALYHELEVHQIELEMQNDELRRVQAELEASASKYKDLYEFAPISYLTMDVFGKILEANLASASLMGRERGHLMNNRFQAYLQQSCIPEFNEFCRCVMESDAKQTAEFQLNGDGSEGKAAGWILVETRAIQNGDYHGFRMAVIDITKRKWMEEELCNARNELELRVKERTAKLQEAKENLEVINEELQVEVSEHEKTEKKLVAAKEAAEAAVEAKTAFLANMSHELRTPLNAVIGYSSLLLDDNLTKEQKEAIESIRTGGEALLAIISDILEFSRAEKEKITLEHQPFSLKRCIEESLDMVAVKAAERGLNLSYTIGYGTPDTLIGDPGRLRQILVNLLSNAVKFTDEGNISVSISSKAIEGNKCQIIFTVKDTGIGMPQDKMARIFEPFTQLEYIISLKRDGAGLGLAISKKLVELMGGEIWAESEEGKGSIFGFTIEAETIPGKILDFGVKDRIEHNTLSAKKPLSILVAEDNPSNQKVLLEMLKRLGYRPDAVADGAEVIQALVIRHYDLIFIDVRMPDMDGLTATKEIRKLWPDNGPTIVAITAYAMESDQKMCLEAGMDGYIAKPVKLEDLAGAISTYRPHENSS